MIDRIALEVLPQFADIDDGAGPQPAQSLAVAPLAGGLINATFSLGRGHILQKLHPIFRPEVNADIAALTPHLRQGGVPVPFILPARDGRPWVEVASPAATAGAWRILTRLPGRTLHKLENPRQAAAAGAMVAQFHAALAGVDRPFAFSRPGAHDTPLHLAHLRAAINELPGHRLHGQVAPLADQLQQLWRDHGRIAELPQRIIHGDLKVSNLLFAGDEVVGVIDLDTMARSSVDIELGDALRSWCNAGAEDDPQPRFQAEVFAQAVGGYAGQARDWLTPAERSSLPDAVVRICLELSARFLADALRETYFGFDRARYPAAGEHNLVRGRNQLGLAADAIRHMPQLRAAVARI